MTLPYCGATHYMPMRDGVTPQMYYKFIDMLMNDGTHRPWLHYLSYADSWQGSSMTPDIQLKLVALDNINANS